MVRRIHQELSRGKRHSVEYKGFIPHIALDYNRMFGRIRSRYSPAQDSIDCNSDRRYYPHTIYTYVKGQRMQLREHDPGIYYNVSFTFR